MMWRSILFQRPTVAVAIVLLLVIGWQLWPVAFPERTPVPWGMTPLGEDE